MVDGEIAGRTKGPPPGPLDIIVWAFVAVALCALACSGGFAVGYWVSRLTGG